MKIHVWHVANQRGYAGTERAMGVWLKELKLPFAAKGFFRSQGLPPFGRSRCDLLHLHRHGETDAGWDQLIRAARDAGVKVIVETNVFGARDESGSGRSLDHHFFMSAMCLWRYAGWPDSLPEDYLARHSVLYLPLRREDFPKAATSPRERAAARKALGLPADGFLAGRLGRPDPNKWPDWLLGSFARLARKDPLAGLVLMQAPDFVGPQVKKMGLQGRVHLLEASADWKKVRLFYQALNCLAHGSRVGESFGYTLAEAQAFGLPVVVASTPWADNAQVELIKHEETGLVALRPAAFSQALFRLADDPGLCARLGEEGRRRAWQRFDSRVLTRDLERVYLALLKNTSVPTQHWVGDFGARYPALLRCLQDPAMIRDAAWSGMAAVKLYWRGWISRGLKWMGLK